MPPVRRQQRRRNPNVIAHVMARSMSNGSLVRAVLRDKAGSHDGVVARKEIDPRRRVKDARKHSENSHLVFVFEDGFEVAVNSIEAAVPLPPDR